MADELKAALTAFVATLRDWEFFDADSGKDLAVEFREYFIPDFSNWRITTPSKPH